MKKLLLTTMLFFLVFALSACEETCIGAECYITPGEIDDNPDDVPDDDGLDSSVVPFDHISGHGDITPRNAYILLEYQLRDYVRYQITYLSCTCRNADVNYWQVAFVEINRYTNEIRTISFSNDSSDHYVAGMWGDSSPTPAGRTLEDFENEFFPWLIGKTLADLDGISVFTNDEYFTIQNTTNIDEQDLIDDFAGSSVSTNNLIRVMKVLLEYHEEKYD